MDNIEREIQGKGLTAPRVTPQAVEDAIENEYYFTAEQGILGSGRIPVEPSLSLMTVCILVLKTGFTVVGHAACVSPENFDAEIGRKVAREHAKEQLWPLLGYSLSEKLKGKE